MNKLTTSIVLVIFAALCCNGQTLSVKSVVELTNDITARTQVRNDANGQACAMLRVNAPSMMVSFDQNIVGDVSVLPGEYIVYVPEATSTIQVKNQEESINVDFSKFDINLEGKKCYRVILDNKERTNSTQEGATINIISNCDNAIVMMDGVPVGQLPLALDNVAPGRHIFSVPNTLGMTMDDVTVSVENGETKKLNFKLHKAEKNPISIRYEYIGVDRTPVATWGFEFLRQNGKIGLKDYFGNTLVPCEFDEVYPLKVNGMYKVKRGNGYGLFSPTRGLVIDCKYHYDLGPMPTCFNPTDYMPFSYDTNSGSIGSGRGVLDPKGKVVIKPDASYRGIPRCYENVIVMCKGFRNANRKDLGGYDDYLRYAIFNKSGNQISQFKYSFLSQFYDGVAYFRLPDDRCGFVDEKGKEVYLPSNIIGVEEFDIYNYECNLDLLLDGLYVVKDKRTEKYGYVNKNAELVIPTIYDYAEQFRNGITVVKYGDKYLTINTQREVITEREQEKGSYEPNMKILNYTRIWRYGDDGYSPKEYVDLSYIQVKDNDDNLGLLFNNGDEILPCKYGDIYIEGTKDYYVICASNYGPFDDTDEGKIVEVYDSIGRKMATLEGVDLIFAKDGFLLVYDRMSKSYGYLNDRGEILANCIYGANDNDSDEENPFVSEDAISEGLAILSIGDRYGFIDNAGNVVVPLNYTAVTPFEDGVALVRDQNGKWSKIYHEEIDSMRFDFE
ncbi:MAG: WG repeat-containing protein [Prevotellaceae bacterium]|nr:WG repeat-containing protein [Candidatus Faecinaster equi]